MSKKERKGFVKEFKEFISRGNIVDMAVGVVVGGAFTTIVNTLVKSVLTPFINYVIYLIAGGKEGTFRNLDIILIPATLDEEGNIVTAATVLEFSALITAIINFVLIALTLFIIIKFINKVRADSDALKERLRKLEEQEAQENQ